MHYYAVCPRCKEHYDLGTSETWWTRQPGREFVLRHAACTEGIGCGIVSEYHWHWGDDWKDMKNMKPEDRDG